MCGIVGYVGEQDCVSVLLQGLKRLEYRGYDSSGITVNSGGTLYTHKRAGKIVVMESSLPEGLRGRNGIGHTRWATHGGVNDLNSHPHSSDDNRISIVHNGIVENYKHLRKRLEGEGCRFSSNTDSEVIAHLINRCYREEGNFEQAFFKALGYIEGTFGIAALCADCPDYLMVARKGSPLVLGVGRNEMFVASDVNAFLGYTKQVVYLEDYEVARLEKDRFVIKDFKRGHIDKDIDTVDWELDSIEKNGYSHYMLKEIHEQPESIRRAFAGRIMEEGGTAKLGGLNLTPQELFNIDKLRIIGCGTSYHAGLIGSYVVEELARVITNVDIASEIRYRNPIIDRNSLFFTVSQSGETIDSLFAMREIQRKGSKALGICNVVGSTIARESDGGVYVHSGPEIAVASTKAFTSQLTVFYLFAILLGRVRDLSHRQGVALLRSLKRVPALVEQILAREEEMEAIAKRYFVLDNFLFLGRGISYPVALEGALKLKEVSYLHSEGVAAGEIKHGPIALIDERTPAIFIVPQDHLHGKVLSNMEEVKARGGRILAICYEGDEKAAELADDCFMVPPIDPLFSPLLTVIPLQLFAFYVAKELGCDIDKPRNLAKSVTVE